MSRPEITIGLSVSLSGKFHPQGQQALQGIRLWQAYINAQGGIAVQNGEKRSVRLIWYDDRSQISFARRNVRQLLREDQIDILLGPYSSSLTMAVMDIAEEYKKLWNYGGSSDEIFNHGRRYLVGVASPASHYLRTLPKLLAEESPALTRTCVLYSGKGTFGWRVARGVLESALGVARHSVHLVPINVPWDNHDTILSVLFGISPEIVALAGSFQDELALMQTRHGWPSTVREVAAVAAGVRAFSAELAQLADGVLGCVSFPCSLLSEAFSWFSPASRSSCECSCDLPSLKSLPCCFSSSRRWEDLLSFCVHGLRYPQHLMCSAGASRWYPSSRCASRGGLDRTGQHFARGEQGAAMPPDMVHGGVGTVRVEVTDGVLDQVNMVVAQDRASSSCPIALEQPTIKQVPIGET